MIHHPWRKARWLLASAFLSAATAVAASDADAVAGSPLPSKLACSTAYTPDSVSIDYGEAGHPEHHHPVVLTPLPEGTLQARDGDTGEELWIYAPPAALLTPDASGPLGPLQVLRFDANNDGFIDREQGDRVWVYFGMRNRGGSYIALDATSRKRISTLWVDSASILPHLALTWAQPTVARLRFADQSQNAEHLVVLLAGGVADPAAPADSTTGREGNRIYAVDAATGALLWSAGAAFDADAPDLVLDSMTFGLAARVVALDLDGDGSSDRLYASDIGAQLWRIDLTNDSPRANFAAGGRIASLGLAQALSPGTADAREFFSAPDISVVVRSEAPAYLALLIGSGNALAIDSVTVQDRLYSLRDDDVFQNRTQDEFNQRLPVLDSDLILVDPQADTPASAQGRGWKRNLRAGEKILADALTTNGVAMISSFEPFSSARPCEGTNRVYVLRADTGRPALDLNDDSVVNLKDDSIELAQTQIAPGVRIMVRKPVETQTSTTPSALLDAIGREVHCVVGSETLAHCAPPGAVIRTYWRRESVR